MEAIEQATYGPHTQWQSAAAFPEDGLLWPSDKQARVHEPVVSNENSDVTITCMKDPTRSSFCNIKSSLITVVCAKLRSLESAHQHLA